MTVSVPPVIVKASLEDRLRTITLTERKVAGASSNTSSVATGNTPPSQFATSSQNPVPPSLVNTAVASTMVKLLVVVPAPIALPTRSVTWVLSITIWWLPSASVSYVN